MKKILLALIFLAGCTSVNHTETPKPEATVPTLKQATGPLMDYSSYYDLTNTDITSSDKSESSLMAKTLEKHSVTCNDLKCQETTASPLSLKVKPYSKKTIRLLQRLPESAITKTAKKVKEEIIKRDINLITDSSIQCPRNLSSAMYKKLEYKDGNRDVLNKLFLNVSHCSYSKSQESIYLRQALLDLYEGHKDLAQKKLKTILDFKDLEDPARVLYWSGVAFNDNHYFETLINTRPYSYHAIKAGEKIGVNAWDVIQKREMVLPSRKESPITLAVENLVYYKHQKEAYKLLTTNMDQFRSKPGELLYLLTLMSKNVTLNYTVQLVSRASYLFPEYFNVQFMQLSYQRPYIEEFKKGSFGPVDQNLLLALTIQESAFNPQARSRANARGLMQLLPGTARLVAKKRVKNLYDPGVNINLGSLYVKSLYTQFNSVEKTLASYNAGPGNVVKWQKNITTKDNLLFTDLIPFQETRSYVTTIMRNHYYYNQIYP